MSCYLCRSEIVSCCKWCSGIICGKHCVYVYEDEVPLICCVNCVPKYDLKPEENYFLEKIQN